MIILHITEEEQEDQVNQRLPEEEVDESVPMIVLQTTVPLSLATALICLEEHRTAIETTASKSMKNACCKDYRRRNKKFIAWLEASQYTTVAAEGIPEFTDAERSNPTKYCFAHKNDLNYDGFNASVFMVFLAETRVKNVGECR